MSVKTVIGLADQLAVKSLFADTRFISCNQEDRLALRVEGKGHSPLTIGRAEPQLLHVCVAQVVQRVNAGPAQLRPKLLQQAGQRQDLRPHVPCAARRTPAQTRR